MPEAFDAVRKRAVFLCALETCGNVTMAAVRAGVGTNWCYRARNADPEFAAAWDGMIALARARLAAAGEAVPRGHADDKVGARELVLVGSAARDSLKVERARTNGWTAAKQAVFLEWLRATCNVRAACRAAGVRAGSAYEKRRGSAALREAWDEAIADGRVTLEGVLIASATNLLAGPDPDYLHDMHDMPGPEITGMDAGVALRLLQTLRPREGAGGRRNNWRLKASDPEAARANILKRVQALRASRESGRESGQDWGHADCAQAAETANG